VRDTSLKVPPAKSGKVIVVRVFTARTAKICRRASNDGSSWSYVAAKRKITARQAAGRHGTGRHRDDHPGGAAFPPDGTPVTSCSPARRAGRMNVGQVGKPTWVGGAGPPSAGRRRLRDWKNRLKGITGLRAEGHPGGGTPVFVPAPARR